ncbi:MAG: hypothetical protein KJ944_02405 [Alphaproteobacteria bacterium]|nr:hypothetical protein [Alphaproteobacteria bacterium]MBU1562814.1 hypothetical protein [Alphaproteobacteria bacterium]MBU2301431.1 hypothetical protein [Alphaproteobacteria bacterium]MBU2368134.1 hypothetical protein [Alphaproteobacteria bacterium]
MLFGLMAIVLIALGGAVVDYVSLEQARNRGQLALDAAALALQPEIFDDTLTAEDIRIQARDLVVDRIGDDRIAITVGQPVINVDEGSLFFTAEMTVPTMFVSLVGVQSLPARIQSEATRKKLALEVAFVLDNSGSMSYTGAGANGTRQRIQFLKDAAKCAVNILFYKDVTDSLDTCIPAAGTTKLDDVKVGIVPFTMFVNVGASNSNATWIDKTGASVISNDNFDNDDNENVAPTVALPTRLELHTATGEGWRGCVVARPHIKSGTLASAYLDTDDTPPVAANTLFVPHFSPDLPDSVGGNNYISDSPAICDRPATTGARCEFTEQRTKNWWGNWNSPTVISSTPSGGSVNFTSNALYPNAFYGDRPPGCSCRNPSYSNWSNGNSSQTRNGWCTGTYVPAGLSPRAYQERVCKYYAGVGGTGFSSGPNADCTRTAILPLTDVPATAISTIDGMLAEGGTNIHEGTVWGMRVLSPTQPFTQGAPYDEATSKIMIVMTDGENTAYNLSTHCTAPRSLNGSCYNSAYGFPYNSRNNASGSTSAGNIERLGNYNNGSFSSNADLVTGMNERTQQTCTNAKSAGITVYVIGLATSQAQQSTQAVVEAMLSNCASTPEKAYFPQTPGELKSVFQAIADDLTALRLAQ